MELGWACSCFVWLLFLCSLAGKLLHCDLLLTLSLLLQVGLVVLLQGFSHLFLPLPISTALTGAACWLVLGGATRRKRVPAVGKAVFITGEYSQHPGRQGDAPPPATLVQLMFNGLAQPGSWRAELSPAGMGGGKWLRRAAPAPTLLNHVGGDRGLHTGLSFLTGSCLVARRLNLVGWRPQGQRLSLPSSVHRGLLP